MRNPKLLTILIILAAIVPQITDATIIQFDDRAAWLAAIGGTPDLEEDFSGFAVDSDFVQPITISMGTIGQVGLDPAFRNFVDVPEFLFGDHNDTNHASCFTNFPEGGPGTETNVEIVFNSYVTAWGADFINAASDEILSIEVIEAGSGTTLGTLTVSSDNLVFLGFVVDAGEEVGAVSLRSTNLNPGPGGEGFGMDDLAAVVPGLIFADGFESGNTSLWSVTQP